MIPATVGRVVWFWHNNHAAGVSYDPKLPFKADIVYPWNDRLINVTYADHNGSWHKLSSVMLLQDDDKKPDGPFCTWMPYQVGQAKKHESNV